MISRRPEMSRRTPRVLVLAKLVVLAAIVAVLGYQFLVPSTIAAPLLRSEHPGSHSQADGVLPDGTTVFDEGMPGVANLDPDLLDALHRAAAAAADDGVELEVNSGWRSAAYQEQLLEEAIDEYGSAKEAARWVATPERSIHVAGGAVDIGPTDAAEWLSDHGAAYGLCRTYRNEPWHYELRPGAVDHGCPSMYADPAHDPRLQS